MVTDLRLVGQGHKCKGPFLVLALSQSCPSLRTQFPLLSFCFLFFFLVFLGLHLQYMEVPRLGVESELQLPCLQPTPQFMATPDP